MKIEIDQNEQALILMLLQNIKIDPYAKEAFSLIASVRSLTTKLNSDEHLERPAENAGR